MRQWARKVRLDRIESVYLKILRVAGLAVATVCLAAALFFSLDAIWRLAVSTDVQEEATVIAPDLLLQRLQTSIPPQTAPTDDGVPASVRTAHERFMQGPFAQYHQTYRSVAERYNKEEDELLDPQMLAAALGYDLESYAAFDDATALLFITDAGYQTQIAEAISAAMASPATTSVLEEYRAAEKTEQRCTTRSERRQVTESCYDWYYGSYSCTRTRNVPVERCVPAYPEGIVSPLMAFGRADGAFRDLWREESDANAQAANLERMEREATRSQIGPKLLLSLQILAGFLIVMFFFLIIAIERHLRKIAETPRDTVEKD